MIRRPFVLAFAFAMIASSSAHAAKTNYSATLTPDQENVPPDLGGKNPSASALFTYDDQTKRLCGKITFQDLTGRPTGIHIRQSPEGDPEGDGPDNRSFALPIPPGNELLLNLLFDTGYEEALGANEIYANIYTQTNPEGEIRSPLYVSADQSAGANIPCPAITSQDAGADASSFFPTGGSSGGPDGNGTSPVPTPEPADAAPKKAPAGGGGCAFGGGAGEVLPFLLALAIVAARRKR
jgi:hypothetical protein